MSTKVNERAQSQRRAQLSYVLPVFACAELFSNCMVYIVRNTKYILYKEYFTALMFTKIIIIKQ